MKKDDILIRPLTKEDILDFFEEPLSMTIKGWVAEYKGEPVCLTAYYIQDKTAIIFSELKQIDLPKKTIFRGAKMLMDKVKSIGLPLTALADECHLNSSNFLKRMGFEQANKEGTLYKWHS